MKFLIDADLPNSLKEVFKKYGHDAVNARDILGSATDDDVFNYARKNECVLVTEI